VTKDIRWKQRFSNLDKAFLQLKEAVELYGEKSEVNAFIKEEFTRWLDVIRRKSSWLPP